MDYLPRVVREAMLASPPRWPPAAHPQTSRGLDCPTVDIVALGDSLVSGRAVNDDEPYTPEDAFPGVYADLLAEEQGVQTMLHSHFPDQLGNEIRSLEEWNDTLATDEQIRGDLAEAEIVIVWLGFHDFVPALMFGSCGSDWETMQPCLDDAVAGMPEQYDTMFTTIDELAGQDARVMIGTGGLPPLFVTSHASQPYWPDLYETVVTRWGQAITDAAAQHGVTVVDTTEALNGPDGTTPPPEEFSVGDGLHLSHAGHAYLAEMFLDSDGLDL